MTQLYTGCTVNSMSNDIQALVFNIDGTVDKITMTEANSLRTMQTLTGGYIEAVYGWTGDPEEDAADVTFFINNEGKVQGLEPNHKATALWWVFDQRMVNVDYLSGVVVVTGGADKDGNTLSVPAKVVEVVERGERG